MKIDLLKRRKTAHDLLIDLEKVLILKKPNKTGVWKRHNVENMAFYFSVSNRKLINWLNFGINKKDEKKYLSIINELCKIFKIAKTKTVSPYYTRNSFSPESFYKLFSGVRQIKAKKDEYFLGRGGMHMKFNNGYIVPVYHISSYDKKQIKSALRKLGVEIKTEIKKFQSLEGFYFVYLSLKKMKIKEL